MALELPTAIQILSFWEELQDVHGQITFDIGVHEHVRSDLLRNNQIYRKSDDIITIGKENEKIELNDFIELLTEVQDLTDELCKYSTFYFRGIFKLEHSDKRLFKVDYKLIWDT